ncbi:hypothetical protein IIA15_08630 [candidate division TA06 bacterium]|nr:hypothetical protein [candidate division TA06 bacterium]
MTLSTDLWIWIGALLTLAIFSFLYKDNPLYKFAEHLFVGISAGYYVVIFSYNSLYPNLLHPLFTEGKLYLIIPGLLGFFFLLRFIPRLGWLSRWSIAFYVGVGSGISIPAVMQAQILAQMKGTMEPLFRTEEWSTFFGTPTFGGFIDLISIPLTTFGVLCVLSYFFFSREHKGVLGGASKIGIIFLMIGFGASFGYTVMARVSLLIGRVFFLMKDWLGIIQ